MFIFPSQKSWHGQFIPHATLQKKLSVHVICCTHLKFSRYDLFSAKKIKAKGTFIVGLRNFYHYLLEVETEAIFCKNNKVPLPEHCAITIKNMLCFW